LSHHTTTQLKEANNPFGVCFMDTFPSLPSLPHQL
jgi:hypothetical protein